MVHFRPAYKGATGRKAENTEYRSEMMATVIKNTTIVTGGPGRTILHDSAIAIEDGRIAALGNSEEVEGRFPGAEVVDGRRKAVFPGLINAHTHLLKTANRGILEDTGFPTTLRFPEDTRALMGKEEDSVFAVLGVIESIRSGATCVLEIEKDIANYAQSLVDTGMRMVVAEYVEDVDMELVRRSEYSYIPAKADEGMRKSVDLIDGWNGGAEGRVTCMTSPSTPEYCSPELLQECRQTADRYDIGMTVHLSESYDEVQAVMRTRGVRPTQYLYVNGALGPRVVAAHCRYLDDSEIALMGQTRTNVSFNPAIAARRGAAAPARELEEAGSNIGMGSDNMDENMLHVLRTGLFAERVRRHTPMSPQPEQMLEWGTMGSARALGLGDQVGSLEVGKKADLFIIDTFRPHLVPNHRIVSAYIHNGQADDVEAVMVDGRWLMKDGKLLTIDEEDVVARAEEMGQTLWRRLLDRNPSVAFPFSLPPR